MCERDRVRVLVVTEQRVERDEDLYTVGVGITDDLRQVLETIARRLPCPVRRRTDIDSIRSRLNSGKCYLLVASRSEEAKRYITMPAVTLTFIECFVPYWGISMH